MPLTTAWSISSSAIGVGFLRTVATNRSSPSAEVVDQRIGPELVDDRLHLVGRLHLARGRSAQVGDRCRSQQPHAHLPDRLGREASRSSSPNFSVSDMRSRVEPRGTDRGQRRLARHRRPRCRPRSPTPRRGRGARAATARDRTRGTSACRRPSPARSRARRAARRRRRTGPAAMTTATGHVQEMARELPRDAVDGMTLGHRPLSRSRGPRSSPSPRTRRAGRSGGRAAPRR